MRDDRTTTKAGLLRALGPPSAAMTGLNALKARYRPLACPLDLVLDLIEPGAKVYDVGCGSGTLMYLAIRLRQAKLAHGYDISEQAVRASTAFARHASEFHARLLSADGTPPDLHGYDTVTVVDVLHHIPPHDQIGFIRRLVGNMECGAKLILLDIDASRLIGVWCNQLHDLLLSREWVHPMRPETVMRALSAAGAEVAPPVFRWTLWYPHFRILARKRAT